MQLEQRRKANREAEAVSGVAEGAVPKGNTPWERVISVCNFNSEGLSKDPFKELSRCVGDSSGRDSTVYIRMVGLFATIPSRCLPMVLPQDPWSPASVISGRRARTLLLVWGRRR